MKLTLEKNCVFIFHINRSINRTIKIWKILTLDYFQSSRVPIKLRERSSLVPRRKAKTALTSARGMLGENATNEGCFFHRVLPKHPRALALACTVRGWERSLPPPGHRIEINQKSSSRENLSLFFNAYVQNTPFWRHPGKFPGHFWPLRDICRVRRLTFCWRFVLIRSYIRRKPAIRTTCRTCQELAYWWRRWHARNDMREDITSKVLTDSLTSGWSLFCGQELMYSSLSVSLSVARIYLKKYWTDVHTGM